MTASKLLLSAPCGASTTGTKGPAAAAAGGAGGNLRVQKPRKCSTVVLDHK